MSKRPCLCLVGLAALGLLAAGARGEEPATAKRQEFRTVRPFWALPGQKTTIQIYGQDLKPQEIRFEQSGCSAKILSVAAYAPKEDADKQRGNTVVEVEVELPAGLKPGHYPFILLGEGVQPERGRLTVDVPAPEIPEQEPNGSLNQPQSLPEGSITVLGKLDGDGVDVFRFTGKAGETWRCEIYARRQTPPSKFEAVLKLRDAHRTPLKGAVDQGEDCALEYRLPADGAYTIEVYDGENRTGGDFTYRLAIRRL
jgi:hypothetical protein